MNSALARVFAVWRTGLPRPVLVLQGGNALNYFGTGLILPFEIIYLHAARGFSTATAGLVLATVMGTAAVVTLPSGALLDCFSAKRILIAGNVVNGLGYGGLAFVDRPWQGFVCSAVGGAGFGLVGTAGQVLTLTLVPAEQRAASTALRRVAGNFGLGLGATVAGFIVAATHHHLQAFQGLYLFDAATFVVFALVVLVWIPDPGLADARSASEGARGFRAVARDRLLLALIASNLALVMIGGAFFSYILPPFAEAHTPVGPVGIGVVVFINTFFIVVAQVPATRVVARMRRTHALFATSAIFAVGLLAVLLATLTHSTLAATTVLAGVAILIAIAECGQFIVLGPLVAEIAPPHLLGRYMSLYQLSFMVGVALGPAVGGVLLGTSPDTIWWGGAAALAVTGAGFLRLGNRIPDPLLPTKSPPLQAASGGWEKAEPERMLATILFTDIVDSTTTAIELGDRRWRELLERHNALVRRELLRYRGREVDSAGDGFFATFDGPARAIRCASAIVDGVREFGLAVRAGLHTGECEIADGKVAGIAVHTGARVAALANAGEVLVSSTVKDLVAGSGIEFIERGAHELKGIPGEWWLFALVAGGYADAP